MLRLKEFDKIYVLVSGGFDSTYLYEKLKKFYKEKVYPVNCFNPYEQNSTLKTISEDPNFIQIKPKKEDKLNYGKILKESFMKLPEAYKLKKQKIYHKKIFPCCYHIKHKHFLDRIEFKNENVVIISGIKRGDGKQRRIWLTQMSKGTHKPNGEPTFFHKHKRGQLYCYPFRDYKKRELPKICKRRLKKKYPKIRHSGCQICPILVLFNIRNEGKRYYKSIDYAQKLGLIKTPKDPCVL